MHKMGIILNEDRQARVQGLQGAVNLIRQANAASLMPSDLMDLYAAVACLTQRMEACWPELANVTTELDRANDVCFELQSDFDMAGLDAEELDFDNGKIYDPEERQPFFQLSDEEREEREL